MLTITASAAVARSFTIVGAPAAPTWNDPVTLNVAGTACAPALSPPVVDREDRTVGLALTDSCDTVLPAPFSIDVLLGRLDAGVWTIRMEDLSQGGVGHTQLGVYDRYDIELESPPVATDAAAVVLVAKVPFPAVECPFAASQRSGSVIAVRLFWGCFPSPFAPPRPLVSEIPIPLDTLPAGDYEIRIDNGLGPSFGDERQLLRTTLRVWDADGCLPADDALCLHHGRFRVEGSWRAFDGSEGVAHAAPLAGNEQSGQLWFFGPDSAELTVKVLAGCGVNDKWWVFISSSSTVEYELRVTDTRTGAERTYSKALGSMPSLVGDTSGFPCS